MAYFEHRPEKSRGCGLDEYGLFKYLTNENESACLRGWGMGVVGWVKWRERILSPSCKNTPEN